MQEKRRLMIAAAVVAAMVLLAFVFGSRDLPQSGGAEHNAVWLPQLKPKLADLQRLQVRGATEAVTLQKGKKGWGVQERAGYPVAFSRLESLLDALARARTVEQKTARAEHLERLGLNDIEKPDSKAVLIEGWAAAKEPLFRVLIGNEADGREGRYVRDAANNQAWLIDTSPDALASVGDWLDPRMLGLDFARVSDVVRVIQGKEGFAASRQRDATSSLNVKVLPAGKKLKYQTAFDNAARAVLTATVEDVKPLAELDFMPDKSALTSVTLFEGVRIDIAAIKREDGNWVRFDVSFDEAKAGDKADTKTTAGPRKEATDLGARLHGWAFKISDYVYDELSKPLADYLDDDKPQATTETPADADQQP